MSDIKKLSGKPAWHELTTGMTINKGGTSKLFNTGERSSEKPTVIEEECRPVSYTHLNAVLGARATVGKRSHIGAGSVLAGVLEPPSATPVIVGDDCMIGGNVVVLEGVEIGNGSVVAAGSVVTENVPEGVVVAGAPAKIVKNKDDKTEEKTELLDDLRG